MHIARSLLYRMGEGVSLDRYPPWTEMPWAETLQTETPLWTESPSGQRPPRTETHWTETPLDRSPPLDRDTAPMNRMTHVQRLSSK